VYDVGVSDGMPYLVMELLEGETLESRVRRGPLPISQTVTLFTEIADALEAAHARQIIHRDLKPANIFITSRGRAKIMDFGIAYQQSPSKPDGEPSLDPAALTKFGDPIGTLSYMSPEQARGERLQPTSDLFSLGIVMYEALTGIRPFQGNSVAVVDALLNAEPGPLTALRPDVPPGLERIVSHLLRKNPAERTASASDLLAGLQAFNPAEDAVDVPTPVVSLRGGAHSRGLRSSWRLAATAMVLAISAAGLTYVLWPSMPSGIQSLAFLPVDDQLAPETSEAVNGLIEAVGNDLGRNQTLQVLPPGAAAVYRSTAKTAQEIGAELKVDALLAVTASVDRDQIVLRASLVKANDGRSFWSSTFERPRGELLALQNDLSGGVARALGVAPAGPGRESIGARTPDSQAYDLYLRARYHASRWNERDIDQAIALLEQSTKIDESFGAAQALLGYAYGVMSANYRPSDQTLMEKGFAAVAKALERGGAAPDAHMARGLLLWQPSEGFAFREALREYELALAERPSFDEAWNQRGITLFHAGHFDEAMRSIDRAIALNPANLNARFRIAPIRVYQQRYEDAVVALRRVPRESYLSQWTYQMAWALIALGRLNEAEQEIATSLARSTTDQGGVIHAARAMLRVKRGDRKGALADIEEAVARGRGFIHFHHTAYSIGAVYVQLGDFERAQQWIEEAAATGFPCFALFETDPFLSQLRERQQFRDFLVRLRREWEHLPGLDSQR
jgi:tetratricopeptide (TPR) repeat protein